MSCKADLQVLARIGSINQCWYISSKIKYIQPMKLPGICCSYEKSCHKVVERHYHTEDLD